MSEKEIKDKITEILSHRHPTDTKEWWQSLGSGASNVIMEIYQETDRTYYKARLMSALSYFHEEQVGSFIKENLEKEDNIVLKNNSLKSLASSQGPKEADYIAKYLDSDEGRIRLAAAKALKRMLDFEGAEPEQLNQVETLLEEYQYLLQEIHFCYQ